jgi:hypothetical protein
MSSNVGSASLYEAGDQRNAPQTDQSKAERFEEGNEKAHDPLDRSAFSLLSLHMSLSTV